MGPSALKPASCRITCQAPPTQAGQGPSRRSLLSAGVAAPFLLLSRPSVASGLESIQLPAPTSTPSFVEEIQRRNRATIDAAEESFQSSDLLKTLKERSEANKEQRAKELRDLYCRRQAELGVGDCAGLRLIPGATKSGIQKKPEWLENLLGGGDTEQ